MNMNQPLQGIQQGMENMVQGVQNVVNDVRSGTVSALIIIVGLLAFVNAVLTFLSFKWTEIILSIVTSVVCAILLAYCKNRNIITIAVIASLILVCIGTLIVFLVAEYTEEEGFSLVIRLVLGIPYIIMGGVILATYGKLCKSIGNGQEFVVGGDQQYQQYQQPQQPQQPQQYQYQRRRIRRRYRY